MAVGNQQKIGASTLHTSIKSFLYGGLVVTLTTQMGHAANEQFNDALRAANANNTALLDQYQMSMQGDALGYYPEYWKLNTNLGFQPTASIVSYAQRYPQSAMAEKLAADYVEEKVKQNDFFSAQAVLPYVTNADRAESCAMAQVRT